MGMEAAATSEVRSPDSLAPPTFHENVGRFTVSVMSLYSVVRIRMDDDTMTPIPEHSHHVNERVHLTVDIPNLGLHRGEVGSVCSIWSLDSDAYEVEFRETDQYPVRALLMREQIQTDEQPQAGAVV